MRISFATPISAWGADLAQAAGGAVLEIGVFDAGDEIATLVISTDDAFLEFQVTSGEQITSIVMRGGDSGPTNVEDLGMDNVRLVSNAPVGNAPEPGTIALLGLGLAGFGVLRRRR